MARFQLLLAAFAAMVTTASSFQHGGMANRWARSAVKAHGGIQRIEFKIYSDGRVEERVFGVKGEECLKITEEINNKLGEVIISQPTEEMVQQDNALANENVVYEQKFTEW
eukprot:CAMPEP_0182532728 /NCGR_PEP_ID=MMETSP1323-20130603/12251_1 /TAXON_ID=236787 /ORGANISM="Florenciella parvula, Strain RCC1693" /LENGTH=110 /DNA_ID=CAMNT_0024742517 /DNA_START=48 /DNA_END=380 /DNA_ORIENTATION=-